MTNILRVSVVLVALIAVQDARCAEFEAHPSVAVNEEYTDNVFESPNNRISDYITRALPGLVMSYKAPALTGDLNYVLDYRHYANETRTDDFAHSLSAKTNFSTLENHLFLDISEEYQRVSLDATRDTTKESLFLNQSDRNVVTVAPYYVFYPIERIKIKTGYRFIDTRYFKTTGIDKQEHIASLDMAYELSKRFSLTAGYTFIRETAVIDDFNQHQALGGFRYEYTDKSFVFAQAGNAWTGYGSGQRLDKVVWNAGVTHVFNTLTGTVTTGVRYDEDPLRNIMQETFVSGIIEQRLSRGLLSFSPGYSEYILTKTDTRQTTKYGATVLGQYEFTADLKGRLGITVEKYEQPRLRSYTRRILIDSGLSYLLGRQLTASITFIYTDYSSPDILAENRHVNRVMVEIKKVF